jgi:hypothetical protein
MYQKSPFPYLIVLVAIIGISCFTNLTIDKEIEQPIIHVIQKKSTVENLSTQEPNLLKETATQIAFAK